MSEFIEGFLEKVRKDEYRIDNELYSKYDVKKGLRNEDGTGVLVGLTKISDVVGYKRVDGKKVDCKGELYYRGINVSDIINKRKPHQRFLFEETCFLILFGYLPNEDELNKFKDEMSKYYELPPNYLESKILGFPSKNLMNKLQQEVLMLYSYDDDPDNTSPKETMYKGLNLIAKIPLIVCYAYRSKVHYFDKESLLEELQEASNWYDELEVLHELALDYRIKSIQSINMKYNRYYPDHQTRKVFDDLLGFRSLCNDYDDILQLEKLPSFRVANMSFGKANDDGYRGVHVYYQHSGIHYPIEIQYNTYYDRQFNNWLHKYTYKKNYPDKVGQTLRYCYENGRITTEKEFKEVLLNVLSSSERCK